VAIVFSYVGLNYGGLQRNPGQDTIEENLFNGLVQAGSINSDNTFSQICWQSCARTDKGVSALGNLISCKINFFNEALKSKINGFLPEDIQIISLRRVGKKFSPKHRCDSRLYSYVLPTSLFAPGPHNKNKTSPESFKFDSNMKTLVDTVFKFYEGTRNYHNFTSKGGPKSFNNASAMRYILSIKCGDPFMIDGEEWVEITILGQSFIIYQIRKMVALALSIIRDGANPRVILTCFEKPKKILPIAPALGLFLNRCNFEEFNKNAALKLNWTQEELDKMNQYKYTQVLPTIIRHNKQNNTFKEWLEKHDQHPQNYEELYCTVEGEYKSKTPIERPITTIEHGSEEEFED